MTKKQKTEADMMSKLCQKHGYTFIANRPGKRITTMFTDGGKRIVPMYTMQLAVPMDSALGKQMQEQYPNKRAKWRDAREAAKKP